MSAAQAVGSPPGPTQHNAPLPLCAGHASPAADLRQATAADLECHVCMQQYSMLMSPPTFGPLLQVMMMGQPEAVIQQAHAEALAAPEVQDDFDIGAEDEAALQVGRLQMQIAVADCCRGDGQTGVSIGCSTCAWLWQWMDDFDIGAEDEAALQVRITQQVVQKHMLCRCINQNTAGGAGLTAVCPGCSAFA
jgi:hypothetical protein